MANPALPTDAALSWKWQYLSMSTAIAAPCQPASHGLATVGRDRVPSLTGNSKATGRDCNAMIASDGLGRTTSAAGNGNAIITDLGGSAVCDSRQAVVASLGAPT